MRKLLEQPHFMMLQLTPEECSEIQYYFNMLQAATLYTPQHQGNVRQTQELDRLVRENKYLKEQVDQITKATQAALSRQSTELKRVRDALGESEAQNQALVEKNGKSQSRVHQLEVELELKIQELELTKLFFEPSGSESKKENTELKRQVTVLKNELSAMTKEARKYCAHLNEIQKQQERNNAGLAVERDRALFVEKALDSFLGEQRESSDVATVPVSSLSQFRDWMRKRVPSATDSAKQAADTPAGRDHRGYWPKA